MPSPNNVTELIIFVGGAIVVMIICVVASRYTAFGKRLTGDWKPGPIVLDNSSRPKLPREKYVDPFAKLQPLVIIGPAVIFLVFLFVFYFLTKNTLQAGN